MSKRQPLLLVEDIIESGEKILLYTSDYSFEQFASDGKTVDAVIRNFEIIGEAAGRLPEKFKDQHTGIDWHRLRGFRNRIVHDYFGIDLNIVWQIKETSLPELIEKLKLI
ncbi:MAG: DUF86 domain-containing protein [Bacteroidetes bacterium]|nr:DUF86 domain-containing protein [Bacteroidota bacterium]